jgi:tetratricopeptide (TPR) repeat protein
MHPDYASSLSNIGSTYQSKGEYDKALEYYFKSIEIMKIVLG